MHRYFTPLDILRAFCLFLISSTCLNADIIISEIFYKQTGSDDLAEFIEIHNTRPDPVDISGYHFDNGVISTPLPANTMIEGGGYRVWVWNVVGFNNQYPSGQYPGITIAGTYVDEVIVPGDTGALDGGGERITLRDASGGRVFSVAYDDDADLNWPTLPDTANYTLVPYRTVSSVDPDEATYWRHSIKPFGSPGVGEPDPGTPPVYVNEIRTRDGALANDAIEIYNPNPDPVNIGNWYLSDNVNSVDGIGAGRKKYRIPANTMVPGNSFVTFSEATVGFGISSRGERLFLYSGDALGNLTGYIHGFYFGASGDGQTFAQHINGDGIEQLVVQEPHTLNDTNAPPRLGSIVMTEVMYNPTNSPIEFIEFQNRSASNVQLFQNADPWRISGATDPFVFPANQTIAPGEIFIVMNTNLAAFTSMTDVPSGTKIFGPYAGSLGNGGERINLERPERLNTGDPLEISYITEDTLFYGDDTPWPSGPDGTGESLTRRELNAHTDESDTWRSSLDDGGSPGWNTIYDGEVVYVNEALTHTDFPSVDVVELYNPNNQGVNIGGWFLTDNRSDPKLFMIPSNTTITANGFWCINEDNDANPGTAAPAGYFGNVFSLSSRGEQLYLSSALHGRLTGYQHGFSFNAAANGVSFGRYVNSENDESFPAQQSVTIIQDRLTANPVGIANGPPLAGPLVISEIYYQNGPTDVEFVELQNIFGVSVNLYDDSLNGQPTNTWTVSGIDFTFPPSPLPTIDANARVILLPFGTDAAGFRSSNNVPASVDIYGGLNGYTGALNNGGERITLIRPDKFDVVQPGNMIVVPRINVDSVRYDDDAPWPFIGEDGGRSIERIDVNSFADDLVNWRASNPAGGTPGFANSTGTVYEVWALNTYTFDERNTPNLTGPSDDFNGDGIPNLLVYGSGFDPRLSPDPSLLSQHLIMDSDGADYLVIRHRRRVDATDLDWLYQRTDDLLGVWEPANASAIPSTDNGDGTRTWFVRDTLPISARPRSFVSVGLTLKP